MSLSYTIQSIIEIIAVGFTVWGLFHEDMFVRWENRIACNIRRKRLKVVKASAQNYYK